LNSIGFVNQSFPVGARHGLKRFQFGSTLMKSAHQRQLKISSSMKSAQQQQQLSEQQQQQQLNASQLSSTSFRFFFTGALSSLRSVFPTVV